MSKKTPPKKTPYCCRPFIQVALVGVVATMTASCVTVGRHQKLEARIAKLEFDRERLKIEMKQDFKRLENVREMLTKAEDALRKGGANLDLRLQRIEEGFPQLRGDLESLQFRLKRALGNLKIVKREIAEKLGSLRVYLPEGLPKDADGIWKAAETAEATGRTKDAQAIYEAFEAAHPKDPRAPQAAMKMASLSARDGDLENAMSRYSKVYDRYPKTVQARKAMLAIGEILLQTKDCARARQVFDLLRKQYRKTAEAKTATQRMVNDVTRCRKDKRVKP